MLYCDQVREEGVDSVVNVEEGSLVSHRGRKRACSRFAHTGEDVHLREQPPGPMLRSDLGFGVVRLVVRNADLVGAPLQPHPSMCVLTTPQTFWAGLGLGAR